MSNVRDELGKRRRLFISEEWLDEPEENKKQASDTVTVMRAVELKNFIDRVETKDHMGIVRTVVGLELEGNNLTILFTEEEAKDDTVVKFPTEVGDTAGGWTVL